MVNAVKSKPTRQTPTPIRHPLVEIAMAAQVFVRVFEARHHGRVPDDVEEARRALKLALAAFTPAEPQTPEPGFSRQQVESALRHIGRVDTERILERLGYTEQEITDAVR